MPRDCVAVRPMPLRFCDDLPRPEPGGHRRGLSLPEDVLVLGDHILVREPERAIQTEAREFALRAMARELHLRRLWDWRSLDGEGDFF